MSEPRTESIDARALITRDLDRAQLAKRRHFLPALGLVVVIIGGVLAVFGLRPDFLTQPSWRLALQAGLWALCLVAFPAIGLGLWFPSKATKICLCVVAAALAVVTSLGWPLVLIGPTAFSPCAMMACLFALVVLGLGVVSGAFVQRRRSSSAFWVAGGISLMAITAVTWHCPGVGMHALANHLVPALALGAVAAVVGFLAHRGRTSPGPGDA